MRIIQFPADGLLLGIALLAIWRTLTPGAVLAAPLPAPPAAQPRLADIRGEELTLHLRAQDRPVRLRAGRLGLLRERVGPLLHGPARGLRLDEVHVEFDRGPEAFELLAKRAVLEGQGSLTFEDCYLRFANAPEIIAADQMLWSSANKIEIPGAYRILTPPDPEAASGGDLSIPFPRGGWRPPRR